MATPEARPARKDEEELGVPAELDPDAAVAEPDDVDHEFTDMEDFSFDLDDDLGSDLSLDAMGDLEFDEPADDFE